jgi:hypothetical protein
MSLGFPYQIGDWALLTGEDGCSTHEDPAAESVRYELYLAHRMSADDVREIFVSTAAGNQPGPEIDSLFPAPPPGVVSPQCAQPNPPGPATFLPAYWQRADSCHLDDPGPHRLALAAGAVDARDRPSGIAIDGAEPPLVAPGQHVYAWHPAALPYSGTPFCLPDPPEPPPEPPPYPAEIGLPRSITGTSVAAALVSGAAARAQTAMLDAGSAALDRRALERLLYLTGEAVCDHLGDQRLSPDHTPVRRLHIARLDHALTSRECADLRACAAFPPGAVTIDPIGVSLQHDCRDALAACGLETLDALGQLDIECASHSSVPWPVGYVPPACDSWTTTSAFVDAATCPGTVCPYEHLPFPSLIGSLGPEPTGGGCPECSITLYGEPPDYALLVLELSADFPPDTTFADPYLVIAGFNGNFWKEYYLDLSESAPEGAFTPGAVLQIQLSLGVIPSTFIWASAEATLTMMVTQPNLEPVTDYSPLKIL